MSGRPSTLPEPGQNFAEAVRVAHLAIDEVARQLQGVMDAGRDYNSQQLFERRQLVVDVNEALQLGVGIKVGDYAATQLFLRRGVSPIWRANSNKERGYQSVHAVVRRSDNGDGLVRLSSSFAEAVCAAYVSIDEVGAHLQVKLDDARIPDTPEYRDRFALVADVKTAMELSLAVSVEGARARQLIEHGSSYSVAWSIGGDTCIGFSKNKATVMRGHESIYAPASPFDAKIA